MRLWISTLLVSTMLAAPVYAQLTQPSVVKPISAFPEPAPLPPQAPVGVPGQSTPYTSAMPPGTAPQGAPVAPPQGAPQAVETKKEYIPLDITVRGIENEASIPPQFAYCIATDKEKSTMTGQNISPEITWSKGPEGTKSYVLIMVDPDVPTVFDDAGKEGKTLPADMKRRDFYHWVVADIPAEITSIAEGASRAVDGRKPVGITAINDYASFIKDKPAETFQGYDGPCPPWNDARIHNYHFLVFALSATSNEYFTYTEKDAAKKTIEKKGFHANATGKELLKAIKPYILAAGKSVGTYTLNPELIQK